MTTPEVAKAHEHYVIGGLLSRVHPTVAQQVKQSLQVTFVGMLRAHCNQLNELAAFEEELATGEEFGSW